MPTWNYCVACNVLAESRIFACNSLYISSDDILCFTCIFVLYVCLHANVASLYVMRSSAQIHVLHAIRCTYHRMVYNVSHASLCYTLALHVNVASLYGMRFIGLATDFACDPLYISSDGIQYITCIFVLYVWRTCQCGIGLCYVMHRSYDGFCIRPIVSIIG